VKQIIVYIDNPVAIKWLVKLTSEDSLYHLHFFRSADLFAVWVQPGSLQVWRQNCNCDRVGKFIPVRGNLLTSQKSGADYLRLQVRFLLFFDEV